MGLHSGLGKVPESAMSRRLRWSRFWWADWINESGLRMAGLEAAGVWMYMLAFMAVDGDPPGYLQQNSRGLSVNDVAKIVGADPKVVRRCMRKLETYGVYSRDENGVIYSRRLVRDFAKFEQASADGKRGGSQATTQRAAAGKPGFVYMVKRGDGAFRVRTTLGRVSGRMAHWRKQPGGAELVASAEVEDPQAALDRLADSYLLSGEWEYLSDDESGAVSECIRAGIPASAPAGTPGCTPGAPPACVCARSFLASSEVSLSDQIRRYFARLFPPALQNAEFAEAWIAWVDYRARRRPRVTADSAAELLAHMAEFPIADSIEAMKISKRLRWQGVFPESVRNGSGGHAGRQSAGGDGWKPKESEELEVGR